MGDASTLLRNIEASRLQRVVIVVVGQAPRYRAPKTHFESVQKATFTGAIWEIS
jgi:hypothetical protein